MRSYGPESATAAAYGRMLTPARALSLNFTHALQGPVAAMAGQIVVFCLVLGLCLGAACGFLWLL